MTKTLLALAVLGLSVGTLFVTHVIDPHGIVACYVILPAGAIFFGLFLISLMLEKESAQYDAEQRDHLAAAQTKSAPPARAPIEPSTRKAVATR